MMYLMEVLDSCPWKHPARGTAEPGALSLKSHPQISPELFDDAATRDQSLST